MSESITYNVDISKEVNPIMVRDAIIECFTQAQQELIEKHAGEIMQLINKLE